MSNYRIERLIGIGGEAVVYEARPLPDGDGPPVACKVMREARRADPGARAQARQEAALGLRITPGQPRLVEVLDCFEDAGERLCIVMELVDGGSLKALCGSGPRLPFPIVRRVLREALEALAYLHGQDVLHRDLSPCNILISSSGSVKVADLGIAKLMQQGHAHTRNYRGKLVYGSPEAIQAATLDVRSDLYTLGAVLYELLAGTPPCGKDESLANIVMRALRESFAPLPPDTPPDLAELAMGLIRTEPDARRPQSAVEALALLRGHDQPVASASELAAMVMTMKSQRGAEPDSAHREASLAPGELLAPGHVLIARPVADEPVHDAAPAPAPAFPLPAEPALPPLPQPSPRVTKDLTGPGSASPGGARLAGAGPGRRHSHGRRARLAQQRDHERRQRPGEQAHSASRAGNGAVVRAVHATLLGVCVLVSGFLLHDRSRDASDAGNVQQRSAMVAPAVAPTPVAALTAAPPASLAPERAEPVARDQPADRGAGPQRARQRGRAAHIRPAPVRERDRPARMEPAELRWEPAVLGSALPPWATP